MGGALRERIGRGKGLIVDGWTNGGIFFVMDMMDMHERA